MWRRPVRELEAEVRTLPASLESVGSLDDLLARLEERAVWAELRGALAGGVRTLRLRRGLSQSALAELIGSSQPRVSMMETADPSVSVSLMLRTLVRLGARRADLAWIIAGTGPG